jgi:hypothetical protein
MQMKKLMMMVTSTVLAVSCLGGGSGGSGGSGGNNSGKMIFVTETKFTGNLGGLTGADAKCNDSGNSPDAAKTHGNGQTYKALLGASNRLPGTNWVLSANTEYVNIAGDKITTTTSNALFPYKSESLDNSICDCLDYSLRAWTGIQLADQRDENGTVTSYQYNLDSTACATWSSAASNIGTNTGGPADDGEDGDWLTTASSTCDLQHAIYCVQQ